MGLSISPTKYNEAGYFKKNKKYPEIMWSSVQLFVELANVSSTEKQKNSN